jgi:two-component system, NtrC family, response regulator HydG
MARILIVDDEPALCRTLALVLKARGHDAVMASTGEEGVSLHTGSGADVAILDLCLPGISGLETLVRLRVDDPDLPCVIMTAHATVPTAVDAMKAGAEDYLTKPFDNDHLLLIVERALSRRAMRRRISELQEDLSARTEFAGIVGRSSAIQRLLRQLAQIARKDETVLITGETGTGKELAARSVHAQSQRAERPLVPVNCAAITPTLAASEWFGHVRGAFTDARQDRRGFFEQAHTGTLFLDEVAELPVDIQATLLRVVQDGQVHRLGSERATTVDVRLIAATNRNLEDEVRRGQFRADLFWRLNVFRVEMPPLRQRPEDLPLLTQYFLDRANAEYHTAVVSVAPAVAERFSRYPWPGNIRELSSVLKRAVLLAAAPVIELEDLPDYLLAPAAVAPPAVGSGRTLEQFLAESEQQLIEMTLARYSGNRSATAAALGIDRRTLHTKLQRYGRSDDDDPDESRNAATPKE